MQSTRYSVHVVAEPTGFWGCPPVPADGLPGLGLVSFPVKLRKAECWQGLQLPRPAAGPELGLGSGHPPRSGSCVCACPATVSGGLVSPESPCARCALFGAAAQPPVRARVPPLPARWLLSCSWSSGREEPYVTAQQPEICFHWDVHCG